MPHKKCQICSKTFHFLTRKRECILCNNTFCKDCTVKVKESGFSRRFCKNCLPNCQRGHSINITEGISEIRDLHDEYLASSPKNVVHNVHVVEDSKTPTGLSGLPNDWEQQVRRRGSSQQEAERLSKHLLMVINSSCKSENGSCFQNLSHLATISKNNPEIKYTIIEQITKKGLEDFWVVEDTITHEHFALKRVNPSSKREKQKILTEVAIMQSCDHVNIVKCIECFFHINSIWIVEELMFISLDELVTVKAGLIDEEIMAYILLEVIKALGYLSEKQIIHRDICSGNIMISRTGEVKIGDFGFAADIANGNKRRGTVVGSPCWMAPEMVSGSNYDHMVDIWSLGIVALELAEGPPPMVKEAPIKILFKIATRPPPQLQNPALWSEEFINFLDKCLQKNPAERLDSKKLLEHPFILKVQDDSQMKLANFIENWIRN